MDKTKNNGFFALFALSRFSSGVKTNLLLGLCLFTFGTCLEIATRGRNVVGGFFLTMIFFVLGQQLVTLDTSTLVQSSTYRKKLQLYYPYMASLPGLFLMYTLLIMLHIWMIAHPAEGISLSQNYQIQTSYIAGLGMYLFAGELFFGFCYKYYIQATIGLLICLIPINILTENDYVRLSGYLGNTLTAAVITGYLFVIAGAILSMIFSNLLYRKPMSTIAFKGIFAKKQ